MAERGKAEESQHTEASASDVEVEFTVRGKNEAIRATTALFAVAGLVSGSVIGRSGQGKTAQVRSSAQSPEDWEDLAREAEEHMHALFGDSADVDVRLRTAGEDPPDVDVAVEAKLAKVPIQVTGEPFKQAASRASRAGTDLLPEPDVSVERDDAYYDELRQAIGRGAPTVLLGASTKSLKRNFEELRALQQGNATQPTVRPESKSQRKPQPGSERSTRPRKPTQSEPASRTAVHIWEAVKFVVWLIGAVSILSLALVTSKVWSDPWNAFMLIVSAVLWTTLSVIVYVRRHAAERWVDRQLVMMRDRRGRGRESTTERSDEKAESKKP